MSKGEKSCYPYPMPSIVPVKNFKVPKSKDARNNTTHALPMKACGTTTLQMQKTTSSNNSQQKKESLAHNNFQSPSQRQRSNSVTGSARRIFENGNGRTDNNSKQYQTPSRPLPFLNLGDNSATGNRSTSILPRSRPEDNYDSPQMIDKKNNEYGGRILPLKKLPDSSISSLIQSGQIRETQNNLESRSSGRSSRSREIIGCGRRSASLGLRNLGNTCYMNSVLQCLARVDWSECKSKSRDDDFVKEFLTLMRNMKASNTTSFDAIAPNAFRRQIDSLSRRFQTSEQNDAHEFLLALLGRLKKGMKVEDGSPGGTKNSIIDNLFDGEMENTVSFNDCRHKSLTCSQPFFTLCLPIPIQVPDYSKHPSSRFSQTESRFSRTEAVELKKCLSFLIKKEEMVGENQLWCIECDPPKLQNGSLNLVLKKLPKVLALYLKRFDLVRKRKLETSVEFPKSLDMDERRTEHATRTCWYHLVAVLNHIGSIDFGHYTADVLADKNWYHYSDSSVMEVSHRFKDPSIKSQEAYILFYEKEDK